MLNHEKIKAKQTIVNGSLWEKQCPKDLFGDTFCTLKINKEKKEEEGNMASSSSSKEIETRTDSKLILNKKAKESQKVTKMQLTSQVDM